MSPTHTTPETDLSVSYLPDVPITAIVKNPANPRHRAVADDELVGSLNAQGQMQPLIIAPHPTEPEKWTLIDGHRRLDGLAKAKIATAKAEVRRDLRSEAQQMEAMLVANGGREDLTAIEEAEGYAQLELLGYKPQAIASAVGRDVKTVRSRLKLLKLSPTTRKKVHAGQMNLDDAAGVAEFADDPEISERLEKASANNLRYELQRAQQQRDSRRAAAERVAELLDAGATELKAPEGSPYYYMDAIKDLGAKRLINTGLEAWADHDGCLAFMTIDIYGSVTVHELCSNPDRHSQALNETEKQRQAESDAREAERLQMAEKAKEERSAWQAAAVVRGTTLLDLVGTNTLMPPQLRDLVRALLPAVLLNLAQEGIQPTLYQQMLNIPEPDRWTYDRDVSWAAGSNRDGSLIADHLRDIAQYSDGILTRALVALLIHIADQEATAAADIDVDEHPVPTRFALSYFDLLTEAGHTFSDVDTALRDDIAGTDTKEAEVA